MKRAMFLLCAALAWCTAQAQRPALFLMMHWSLTMAGRRP